ncbi:MAG TPA: tail fiber protein [Meiothermus sp.]|jgi:microcystin-dependent protein|nr:tail fiber protein [Meiothermus sp.]
MADPFVAEIRIFAGNFAPTGWALCNGQLMPISQNTALFSLVGTNYGGDGRTTFGLPNLQGRAPMMWGQGTGLTLRDIGEAGGEETVTLLQSQIPSHNHVVQAVNDLADSSNPSGSLARATNLQVYAAAAPNAALSPQAIGLAGNNQPHNNLQPYLVLTFIIALQGIFPPRG